MRARGSRVRPRGLGDRGRGRPRSRYEGSCPKCGSRREFVFRIPEKVVLPGPVVDLGPGGPSELLDPGEWLFVADRYERVVPGKVTPGTEAARVARQHLGTAIAAINEVLAFVSDGADAVPPKAFRTERGRAVYDEQPGRFRRDHLEVVRDTYLRILAEMDDKSGLSRHP